MVEEWIGSLAVICTTISFLPQVTKSLQSKSVDDLSLFTIIIFSVATASWLIYGSLKQDIPIIIANSIMILFLSILLHLKIRYKPE